MSSKRRAYGYVRLSNDGDKNQNSLQNQKRILTDYAENNGYNLIKIFEDNNVSGTNFNRKGIEELIKEVENGEVDIVLTKDLSRIGRNKVYSSIFLEYLRRLNVRVISITEGFDNFNDNDYMLINFKQMLNEQYVEDISKKIKAGFKQKQKDGLVIIPPFGYKKDIKTKEIEINHECAEIVRKIYNLYIDGNGIKKIALLLTLQGIHTPSWYQKQIYGKVYQPGKKWIGKDLWSDRTISTILENEAYIGILRCGVSERSVIYRYKKRLPREEHIIHKGFYPSIITDEIWGKVQDIKKNKSNNKDKNIQNLRRHKYAGLLICGDCGASFVAKNRSYNDKKYVEYVCNAYHRYGNNVCSSHRIKEKDIDIMLCNYLKSVKNIVKKNVFEIADFIENFDDEKINYSKEIYKIQYEVTNFKNEIKEYAKQLARNLITEDLFKELTKENSEKILLLEKQIDSLVDINKISKDAKLLLKHMIVLLDKILEKQEINNEDIQILINKISIKDNKDGMLGFQVKLNNPLEKNASLFDIFTKVNS
ncbi:MAG: recombinase family protein [Clostridium sp.]|uniref:recombinase family protein n=1 Tax=Clostridium sp. TaxID=1506 RepID=UPI0039EC6D10